MLRILVVAVCCVSAFVPVRAQLVKEWSPWPVLVNADSLDVPFWGGINSPKPSLVDFDGDDLVDLMIGETKGKVTYFRNWGTTAAPQWLPVTERLGGVNTRTWHRLADIDNDGDLDLFCDDGLLMTAYYRNESVGPNVVFEFVRDSFGLFETGFNNTGMFADLDNDGDLDFFLGAVTGELWHYSNEGDESLPLFVLESTLYDSVFAFPGGLATGIQSTNDPMHGFSTITMEDFDMDGDKDLFWGDINNSSTYLFANLGTPAVSDLTEQTESYLPIATFGLNHTALADIDDDGDVDIINGAANGNDIDNLILLRNTGTPTSPAYTVEDFNLIKNIDVGSYAMPTFGDLDADGDLDLLIGRGDGRLSHFENIGSETSPSMSLTSNFYKNIDVGLSAAPVLIDWDADSDLDLLIGTEAGKIEFWRNAGSVAVFDPVKVSAQLAGIQVDILAIPCPADWNGDGLIDLVVGEWDFNGFANLLLYENIGDPEAPFLSLVTNRLLKRIPRDFTIPVAYDWNCDGRRDLLVGGRFFGSTYFENSAPEGAYPDSLTMIAQAGSLPWFDDGYRLAPAFADIDADSDRDVFVGEEDGGLNFYRRGPLSCSCPRHGDPSGDGNHTVLDVIQTINIAFRGDDNVSDPECCPHVSRVDHNCDCQITVLDVVAIVNTAFRAGPAPCNPCLQGNECF